MTLMQTKLLRSFALLLTVGLGVMSIVATSPPGPNAQFSLKNGLRFQDICPEQQVLVEWELYNGANPRLTAEPLDSTLPTLNSYKIDREGELQLEILSETLIQLDVDNGRDSASNSAIYLSEAPAEVCAQFDISPFGLYRGVLEQTAPSPLTVGRELEISFEQERITALISYDEFRDANSSDRNYEPTDEFGRFYLECEAAPNSGLVCRGYKDKAQRLTGRLTQEGFTGTFQGLGENATPSTAGRFSLSKLP